MRELEKIYQKEGRILYQPYPNFYQPVQTQNRQQQPMQQLPQQLQPSFLKGRLVSSIDEVRATPIDFDGSVFFFPDVANKRIYTKQINLDGTASLNMYELKDMPVPAATSSNDTYITREEFDSVISQLQNTLNSFKPLQAQNQQAPSQKPEAEFKF